jgi:hypothetical protein
MANVGLTPQSVNVFGGHKIQGRGGGADRIAVMRLLLPSGWCSKSSPSRSHAEQPAEATIPASAACDAQILVLDDILGMLTGFRPMPNWAQGPKLPLPNTRLVFGKGALPRPSISMGCAEGRRSRTSVPDRSYICRASHRRDGMAPLERQRRGGADQGALYEGRSSLVCSALQTCDRVIVTLFVNSKQFNSGSSRGNRSAIGSAASIDWPARSQPPSSAKQGSSTM